TADPPRRHDHHDHGADLAAVGHRDLARRAGSRRRPGRPAGPGRRHQCAIPPAARPAGGGDPPGTRQPGHAARCHRTAAGRPSPLPRPRRTRLLGSAIGPLRSHSSPRCSLADTWLSRPGGSPAMTRLSADQVAEYAHQAGFRGEALTIAVAVALAESGGRTAIRGDTKITDETLRPSIRLSPIRSP